VRRELAQALAKELAKRLVAVVTPSDADDGRVRSPDAPKITSVVGPGVGSMRRPSCRGLMCTLIVTP
jgi:hypothetical protein